LAVPAQEWAEVGQSLRPPQDDAEGQTQLIALAAEIETLLPDTELPKESSADSPDDGRRARAAAATQLAEALRARQAALKEFLALRAQVNAMTHAAASSAAAEEVIKLQERLQETKSSLAVRPPMVSAEEIEHAEREWRTANDDFMIRTAGRADRIKALADAAARKESAAAQPQSAVSGYMEQVPQLEARIQAAANDAEKAAARFALRTAQIQTSLVMLKAEQVGLEIQRDTLWLEQTERQLPLLKELAATLDDRLERWKRIRARGERQRIRDWVEFVTAHPHAVSAFEQLYWPLRLHMAESLSELEQMQRKAGTIDRFPEEKLLDLKATQGGGLAIWNQFIVSLERRPREQIQERFREIGQRIHFWRNEELQLRRLADKSFDDRSEIELRANEIEEEVRQRIQATKDQTGADASPAATELRLELARQKQAFDEELQTLRGELQKLCDRLSEAVRLTAAYVETLHGLRSTMYWTYLGINDQPLWKYEHAKAVEHWNQESRRQKRERDIEVIAKGFADVSAAGWFTLGGLVIAGLVPSVLLRFKLLRDADVLEARVGEKMQESSAPVAPLSDRLHFQLMRFMASTAPAFVPTVLVWWWLRLSPLDGRVARPALIFAAVAAAVHGMIQTAFSGNKPRFRLLPCSNVVARYHQRWLYGMLYLTVVLVPVPLFFTVMEWAFYVRGHLWAVYKIIMLIVALVFLSRKQTILRVVGRPENVRHPTFLAFVSTLYPLLYLYVVGLLVAQIAGYGALTTYLIGATTASVGVLFAAALALRYVADLLNKLQLRLRAAAERGQEGAHVSETERAAALAAGREVAMVEAPPALDADLPIGVLISLLRLGVWGFALILVLGFWGVGWVDLKGWMNLELVAAGTDGRPPITIGRALLAVTVVLASWMVSRSIRSVLETRVFPTYSQLDRGGRVAVNTVLHYLLLLVGLYFAMYLLRIPLGAVTVVLGTLGLGLGLASQPLFMNFLSGLIMLFERHVTVGDIVEVDGVLGEVTNISIRATTIKTFDNVDMVIPNGEFVGNKVVNWTLRDERIRGKVEVGVAYGADPRTVEKLLLQIARESPLVLNDPPPRVRFMKFGDNSLDFVLYAWFRNVTDRWDFLTDARYRIVELFKVHEIEIPFPQRTLSLKEGQPLRVEVVEGSTALDKT
jgi:small-conductance mechanosensitive channel